MPRCHAKFARCAAQVAIVKACEAAEGNSSKGEALLAAVPKQARADLGYALCRLHRLLAHDDVVAAVKLLAEVSGNHLQRQDTDERWRERRALSRRLLDLRDTKAAYDVVSEAAAPAILIIVQNSISCRAGSAAFSVGSNHRASTFRES